MVVRVRVSAALKAVIATGLRVGAASCLLMGVWIVAAGLRWAGTFPVEAGMLSHWQVWIACGVALQLAAFRVKREKRQLLS